MLYRIGRDGTIGSKSLSLGPCLAIFICDLGIRILGKNKGSDNGNRFLENRKDRVGREEARR
jgi:hypothetical protein